MANLAANERVYSTLNAGPMADPPLFGVVDYVNGAGKDLVRVNWESGAVQYFDTIVDTECALQAFTDDGAPAFPVGSRHTHAGGGVVVRAMVITGGAKRVLLRLPDDLYAIAAG